MPASLIVSPPLDFPPPWAGGWGQDRRGLFAEVVVGGVSIEMRSIPAGDFLMGSPSNENGRREDEVPHRVRLTRSFWLGRHPVTQAEYEAVMGKNPSQFKGPRRPVENLGWNDVVAFCARLTEIARSEGALDERCEFRLPTEAEWEYACRAGTTGAFNDGSACTKPDGKDPALDALGWFDENSGAETHPVGEKAPNAWGLYDMHGNVWEWCADWADWENRVVTDTYVDDAVDPRCEKGARRVVRGGSAWIYARWCRSAYRLAFGPGFRIWGLGFRLAAGQPAGSGASGPEVRGAAAPVPEARTGGTERGAGRARGAI